MNPITHVEKQVEFVLDDLVSRGVLQWQNRIDMKTLLNPYGECYVLIEANDEDIYHAVIDAMGAHKMMDKNGGDDVDEDGPVKPCPN
jgi:hypothetical protein